MKKLTAAAGCVHTVDNKAATNVNAANSIGAFTIHETAGVHRIGS